MDRKNSTAALGSISAPKAGVIAASAAALIILRMGVTIMVGRRRPRRGHGEGLGAPRLIAATPVQYSVRNKSEFLRLLKHRLSAKPFAGVTYAVAGGPDFIIWGTVIVPILAIIGPAIYPTTVLDPDPNGTPVDAAVYAIIRRHRALRQLFRQKLRDAINRIRTGLWVRTYGW